MELVFVRHGESEANVLQKEGSGFYCGRWDCSLTDVGRMQARGLRDCGLVRGADAVFCSPLKRAMETAAEFAGDGFIVEPRITERSMGDFEGKRKYELEEVGEYRKYFTDERFMRFRESFTVSAPNGESYVDVIRRVTPFLEELKSGGHRRVVIVSHLIAIRCMIKVVKGLSEEETFLVKARQCEPILVEY